MPQFAPFDYGKTMANVENIRGARTRNVLAQQQLDPQSARNVLAQKQEQRAQQSEARTQAEHERNIKKWDRETRFEDKKEIYRINTEIANNPEAAERIWAQGKAAGLPLPDVDFANMPIEQRRITAATSAQAMEKSLQEITTTNRMGKYNPGDFTPASWAKFVQAGGNDANASLLERYEAPRVTTVGGAPSVVGMSGGGVGEVTPLSTVEEEAEAESLVASAQETGKLKSQLKWKPAIMSAVKKAESEAKERGEAFTDLSRAEAAMPGLLETVGELKDLAAISTSTLGGKAWDQIVQQTGFGSTKGATAQAKFIAIVNNQVLPLLKPTFGAAFTVVEGQELKATMGDPNATPEAKMAQLEAFIAQKYRDIQTKRRQLGPKDTGDSSGVDMGGWTVEEM